MRNPNLQAVLARSPQCQRLLHSTRAHSTTSTSTQTRIKFFVFLQRQSANSARRQQASSFRLQHRDFHHIYPAPLPLKFPAGHDTLLPVVLAANNLVLPPIVEFEHGYGDPDGLFKSVISLEYSSKGKPLKVASRTAFGELTAEERVVPFFVSHHPPPILNRVYNGLNHDRNDVASTHSHAHSGPPKPIGWLIPEVAAAISRDHLRHFQRDSASPWDVRYFEPGEIESPESSSSPKDVLESGRRQVVKSVAFADWVNEGGSHARTLHIERLLLDWRRKKVFGDVLKAWSEEPYPVFNHPSQDLEEPLAFAIEKAALPIFGLANYGALLTAYVHDPATNETKLWIPQRSKNKKNSPGRLDVTAGGGMRLGDTPLSTILREASEEALLDAEYLNTFLKPVGTVPFLHRSSNLPTTPSKSEGRAESSSQVSETRPQPHTFSLSEHPSHPTSPQQYILPGHYYLYELSLPVDLTIRPQTNLLDGEVDSFHLLPVDQVLENLVKGRFKRSSGLGIVDFLIRGGWVTEENDIHYAEVVRVLRGGLGSGSVPVPWRNIGV